MISFKLKFLLLFIILILTITLLKFEVVVPGDGVITGSIGDVDIVTPDSGFIDLVNVKEGGIIEKDQTIFSYNNLETYYRENSLVNLINFLKNKYNKTTNDIKSLEEIYNLSKQSFSLIANDNEKSLKNYTTRYVKEFNSIAKKQKNAERTKRLNLLEKNEIEKEKKILINKIDLLKKSSSPRIEILDNEKEISKLNASTIRLDSDIFSSEIEIENIIDDFQISLLEKINILTEELAKLEREIIESNDSLSLTLSKKKANVITSPVTGTVMTVEANFTVGSYIEASQKVMTIKQTQSNSLIKAKVSARYRPFINNDNLVKIAINSSGYKKTLKGKIIYISVDSLKNEDNPAISERFYEVEIEPDASEEFSNQMIGLQVNIFVVTNKISILEYITATIVDNIRFNVW